MRSTFTPTTMAGNPVFGVNCSICARRNVKKPDEAISVLVLQNGQTGNLEFSQINGLFSQFSNCAGKSATCAYTGLRNISWNFSYCEE